MRNKVIYVLVLMLIVGCTVTLVGVKHSNNVDLNVHSETDGIDSVGVGHRVDINKVKSKRLDTISN